jgi:hypothetical protein
VVLGVECAVDTIITKLSPVGAIKPTLCFLAGTVDAVPWTGPRQRSVRGGIEVFFKKWYQS